MHPVSVSNIYDSPHSRNDALVADPLSCASQSFWDATTDTSAHAFKDAFLTVPTDRCANWKQYNGCWWEQKKLKGVWTWKVP